MNTMAGGGIYGSRWETAKRWLADLVGPWQHLKKTHTLTHTNSLCDYLLCQDMGRDIFAIIAPVVGGGGCKVTY